MSQMSIRKIAGSILTVILLSTGSIFGQDSIPWTRGIRLGCDVSRFTLGEFQPGRKGIEFTIDTEVKSNLYVTLEAGIEGAIRNNDRIRYKSNGYYGRIGFDYNMLKLKDSHHKDMVYVGARYGYYSIEQQTDWYMVPNPLISGDTLVGSIPPANLNGHWLEGVFGVKVELFRNFYLGTSMRLRSLIYTKKGANFPLFNPGYGNGSKKLNFGLTYTISYQIPFMKVLPKNYKK